MTRAFIEKVEFPASPPGGAGSKISVIASFGQRSIDPDSAKACIQTPTVFVQLPVKSYHLDFVFDGYTYQPASASVETARMFGPQQ